MDIAVVCASVENERLLDFRIAGGARPFVVAQMERANVRLGEADRMIGHCPSVGVAECVTSGMTMNGRAGRLCSPRQKARAFADQKGNERVGAHPPPNAALWGIFSAPTRSPAQAAHIFGCGKMTRTS
jgi:hypothetical protein